MLDRLEERKEERQEEKLQERKARNGHERKNEKLYEEETPRETRRERRLREKMEAEKLASQIGDQLTINLPDEKEEDGKRKKYDHSGDNLDIPFFGKKKQEEPKEASPDVIEANLFKQEQEQKEEKVKEVLQLEHTITVEDENYEFPPVQLLSEPEKKAVKGGKKAVTDTAAKLQKTLYSFGVSAKVENASVGPAKIGRAHV